MHKLSGLTLALLSFGFSTMVAAHGEDKLGPHNGYIQMPGAYHTEVIPQKNAIHIMLLTINFEEPIAADSFVKASIESNHSTTALECTIKDNFFTCPVDDKLLQRKGTLIIASKRGNAEGMTVKYALPLSLKK